MKYLFVVFLVTVSCVPPQPYPDYGGIQPDDGKGNSGALYCDKDLGICFYRLKHHHCKK